MKHQERLRAKSAKQEEVKAPLVKTSQANLEFSPASSVSRVAKSPADLRKLMENTIKEESERQRIESHQLPLKSILKKPNAEEEAAITPIIEKVIERNPIPSVQAEAPVEDS